MKKNKNYRRQKELSSGVAHLFICVANLSLKNDKSYPIMEIVAQAKNSLTLSKKEKKAMKEAYATLC